MTNTIFRFIPTEGMAYCYGTNHNDAGSKGICTRCMRNVVRDIDDRSKLYDLSTRCNAADRVVEDYCCWASRHVCDDETVARVTVERESSIAAGKLVLGATAIVYRGRKVAKGTTGMIVWTGTGYDYNGAAYTKFGLRDAEGTLHWVKANYCVATVSIPVISAEDAAKADPAHAEEYTAGDDYKAPVARSQGSHVGCSHEATKAARAACRKARAKG